MKKRFASCIMVIFMVMVSVTPEVKSAGLADSGWIGTRGGYTLYLRNENDTYLYGTVHLSRKGTGDYRYPCTSFTPKTARQVQIYAGSSSNDYETYRSKYSSDEKVLKYGVPVYYTEKNYGRVYVVK